jgi:hypothetical protein
MQQMMHLAHAGPDGCSSSERLSKLEQQPGQQQQHTLQRSSNLTAAEGRQQQWSCSRAAAAGSSACRVCKIIGFLRSSQG